MKRVLTLMAAVGFVTAVGAAQAPAADDLYFEALHVQEVRGDLPRAIELYKAILDRHAGNRAVAPKALLQLGECYQKLGKAEARPVYERLVREYPDSGGIVSTARARLAALQAETADPFTRRELDIGLGVLWVVGNMMSPDGRYAVYHRDGGAAAGSRIYLRDMASGAERVLFDLDGVANNFAWSPDSRAVAFNFQNPQKGVRDVRIATIPGGEIRTLPLRDYPLGWTTTDEVLLYRPNYGANALDLYLAPARGGEARKVVSWPFNEGGAPLILPDASAMVATRNKRLVLASLRTGQEQAITEGSAEEIRPVLSADGRLVAFASNRDGRWALYVAPLDRLPVAHPVRIAWLSPAGLMGSGTTRDWWTRDGGLSMAFAYSEGDVFRLEMDPASGARLSEPRRLTQDLPISFNPVVSPDGKQVAYYYGNGTRTGIAVMDADGLNERTLLRQEGRLPLAWRGPGEILFYDFATPGGQRPAITVFDVRTGTQTPLAQLSGLYWKYVPARREILHSHPGGGGAKPGLVLKARSLEDDTDRDVATIDNLMPWIAVSRDGEHIAYNVKSDVGGDPAVVSCELAVMTIGGAPDRVLIPHGQPCASPVDWSPGGRFLLVNTERGPRVIDVETTHSWDVHPDVVNDPSDDSRPSWNASSWSPDGSFILLTRGQTRRERVLWEGVTYDAVVRLMSGRNGGI